MFTTTEASKQATVSTAASKQAAVRRLNINLPFAVYEQLDELAKTSSRTMTDIVRTALGLVRVAIDAETSGNKLAVVNPEGKLLKEIVLLR